MNILNTIIDIRIKVPQIMGPTFLRLAKNFSPSGKCFPFPLLQLFKVNTFLSFLLKGAIIAFLEIQDL